MPKDAPLEFDKEASESLIKIGSDKKMPKEKTLKNLEKSEKEKSEEEEIQRAIEEDKIDELLFKAVKEGKATMAMTLISLGANVDKAEENNVNVLQEAARGDNQTIVAALSFFASDETRDKASREGEAKPEMCEIIKTVKSTFSQSARLNDQVQSSQATKSVVGPWSRYIKDRQAESATMGGR